MLGKRAITPIIEAASVAIATVAVNMFFPDQPGFSNLFFIPYPLAALLFSTLYGSAFGLISLGFSVAAVAGVFPLVASLVYPEWSIDGYWLELVEVIAIPGPIALLLVYAFGVIRSAAKETERRLRTRVEKLSKQNWLLKQKSESLFKVNIELDERVSKQTESITSLYTQFQKLDILDLALALDVFLETVQIFTGATRCSVWKYDEYDDHLVLVANRGWEDVESAQTSIPVEDTIEGWVYRNNNLFSARMTLQYDNLAAMDKGRTLITLPLMLQRKSWGIVNISEMPFEKYSQYTERLLHIIVSLAEHSIEEAVFYESIIRNDEKDERRSTEKETEELIMIHGEMKRNGAKKTERRGRETL